MIKRLAVFALTAALTALVVGPASLEAKDKKSEREKMKEAREKVREKYEGEKKGGFTTYDLSYWVDMKKIEDRRWNKQDLREPDYFGGLQLHAKWANEASAAAGMTIDVLVVRHPHSKTVGGSTTNYSIPFDNIGKSIKTSEVEKIAEGFYEDWKRQAKDVIEDKSYGPKKCKFKVPKFEAAVTATDPESNERVRREWYIWADGKNKATYRIEIRYGSAILDKEGLLAKGPEFVKNFKELKDKNVKWPPPR